MKRVLSIQDISCVGKCSLTVALPIISAAGLETSILPTAVLSTHTAFKDFTFRDLTEDIQPIANHWKQENILFDGIYTGYLGSAQQIEIVEKLFDNFDHQNMLKFVDPAMGDNGKLYVGFTPDFAKKMGKLCGKADIIVPNLTEAAFMLGEDFLGNSYTETEICDLLKRLCSLGCPKAVLTGVVSPAGMLGVAAYDANNDSFFTYFNEYLPVSFHGTGDVFASAAFAAMMRGKALNSALAIAVDYTVNSLRETLSYPDHNWYGVDFETTLFDFIQALKD